MFIADRTSRRAYNAQGTQPPSFLFFLETKVYLTERKGWRGGDVALRKSCSEKNYATHLLEQTATRAPEKETNIYAVSPAAKWASSSRNLLLKPAFNKMNTLLPPPTHPPCLPLRPEVSSHEKNNPANPAGESNEEKRTGRQRSSTRDRAQHHHPQAKRSGRAKHRTDHNKKIRCA